MVLSLVSFAGLTEIFDLNYLVTSPVMFEAILKKIYNGLNFITQINQHEIFTPNLQLDLTFGLRQKLLQLSPENI